MNLIHINFKERVVIRLYLRFIQRRHRFRLQLVEHGRVVGPMIEHRKGLILEHTTVEIDEVKVQVDARLAAEAGCHIVIPLFALFFFEVVLFCLF